MRRSRYARHWFLPWLALVISACANQIATLPVCDGEHRRPANPYGSVLIGRGEAVSSLPKSIPGAISAHSLSGASCEGHP
jgi:hypothetical protein